MVNTASETPRNTVHFDSLANLREELGKQAHNAERLDEFQKTIDEAIEKGDREGIIEFTEDEWKSLITNEDLPPIEQVKTLLRNKIEGMKEVKKESKEKREGIMGELDKKVDEAKKAVEEVKEKATGSIKEALSPLEKIKDGLENAQKSLGEMWTNLWTPIKFAWHTLWASLGFKFGKEALAAMTKEKTEKVVEDAKKKAGEITKGGEETAKEGKEGVTEKIAPLAILGGAGIGILGLIKNKLPKGLLDKIGDTTDKTGFLKKLAGNRALRLFGISGLTLFGIGKLSETLQDPKIAAELGEIPESPEEAKKEWWKKAIEKAGIGIKDGAEEIWSLVSGEKLDEYLTSREDDEEMKERGYVRLGEHPSILGAKKQLGIFEKQCEEFFNQNRQAFDAAVVAGLICKPGMILGAGAKGASVAMGILKVAHPNTIIPAGIVLALLGNSIEAMKHIKVPKDLGPEDLKDMLEIPDIKEFLESRIPGVTEQIHFDTVAKEFETLEQKIKEFNTKSLWEKLAKGAADKIIESPQEKINSANEVGMKTLVSSLELLERKNETPGSYKTLLGDEKEPGVLKNLITKLGAGNALTEGDIRTLMEAAEGTNIRIFPRNNTKSGTTIQWQTVDEHGTIKGLPRNICVNPTIEYESQFEAARDFVVDEYDINTMNVAGKAYEGFREIASELAESIKNNHEKSGSLIEALVRDGGSILTIGLETFAFDYLGNKYLLGPWNVVQGAFMGIDKPEDKLEMQEGLVEYGQGLAPVILITGIKNQLSGHGFFGFKNRGIIDKITGNTVIKSITYPLHILKGVGKGGVIGGKYIYERVFAGDYKSVLSDPKNQFTAYFRENLHKFKGLQAKLPGESFRDIGGLHKNIGKLEEARKLIYDAKQSSWSREEKLKEAFEILEKESSKFEKGVASRNLSNEKIKSILEKLEAEIEEQKKALSYLEQGVRQHFSQELKNRTDQVENRKGQIDIETPEGKKAAQEAFDKSQIEIENMEKERLRIEKEHKEAKKAFDANPNDINLKKDFETKRSTYNKMIGDYDTNHRNLSEIREAMGELLHGRKPKIKIGENHIKSVKGLRGAAKILGILVVTVGAGVAIEKVATALHGDTSEIDKGNTLSDQDDEKYYGFKKDNKEENAEKKEKNEYTCETPEEFNKRIEAIETQYTEAISKFFDPEFVNNLSAEEREKKIQEAADGHMLRVDMMKSLIRENKTMMEAFWNKKFTNEETGEEIVPADIREQGVKAFMFIHKKDGKLTLDYMNHQDMKNVFYILYDASHQSLLEQGLGEKGGMAADLALRVAPFTGSFMDGKDAYEHFSRGNTMDGVWSTAWCIGGLILDIGGVVSGGTTTVAGSGLRAAKVAKIAKSAGGALLHNGVQIGVQFGTSLAKVPRSESVSIESI